MIRTIRLGAGEAWRNRRINVALGLILSIGIVAQLWAVMTANVSEAALARYNVEHFGEAETWTLQSDREASVAQLVGLQEYLVRRRAEQPGLRIAATGELLAKVTDGTRGEPVEVGLLAIDPAWAVVSQAPIDRDLFAAPPDGVVHVAWSRPPAGIDAPCLTVSSHIADGVAPAGAAPPSPPALCRIGYRREPNESFAADGYIAAGPPLEALRGSATVAVTYVCGHRAAPRCGAIARRALGDAGLPTRAQPLRTDKSTRFLPVLRQRARDNRRAANLVAIVAVAGVALAATIAATGRARRYTLFRCLGATRARVGWISGVEAGVLTAVCAALCTSALLAVMQVAPGAFSSLDGIEPAPAPPSATDIRWLAIKLVALGLATSVPAATAAAASRLALE